ncbi:MAG TPA: RHS repeat-associated core domain-containing protein, partial [Chryseolinea sp.]|nr:RHS repeat-associated core domain-containing protein [Chryseolinea sp.]
ELDLNRIIGFSDVNTNADITTIDYGMVLVGDQLRAYTNGTSRKTVSGMKSGDIFRLERIGSTIQSKINGSLFYTYPAPSTGSLLVDVAFRTPSSSMAGVRTSFTIKSQSIVKTYSYDHAGRLLTTRHKLTDGQEIVLSSNIYNEAGQLIDKKLHSDDNGSSYSQSVDYRYNIRGWLTKINESDLTAQEPGDAADLFGMELAYDKDLSTGNASDLQFSGNISAIKWNKDLGQGTVKENAYNYSYDPMNRIKGAAFKEYINSWSDANGQSFSESSYLYDLNGNIQQLTRKGENGSPMDILAYDYGTASTYGNKLLKVADTGDKYKGFVDGANTGNDYTYDLSGNMLTDQNKGITANIVYNYMNLPEIVTRGANGIRFIYDATGKRIGKYAVFVKESTHTENIGDFEYEGGVVKTVYHDEGRIVFGEEKLVYKHDGSSTDDITASTASLALVTSASSETYVRATSSGTSTLQGIFPIGQAIPVAQGERYKVRVKAYRGTSGAFILVKVNGVNMNWPGAALPATVSGEAWTEHLVTIPVNGTSMEVGVKWVNVANGEQIFLNELEVIKLEQSAPEYQYSLKDHLGNVRLTFTTKQEVETTTATLEFDVEDEDRSNYLRYDMAKRVNSRLFDHTHADSTGYAVRLNGLEDERVGLAKSLSVMPGDTIRAKVYAKYVDTNTGNLSTALTTLLTQVSQGTAGVVVDGPGYPTSSSTPLGIGAIDHGDDDTGEAPMAYLNCVFINRKYDTNSIRAKAVRMSDAGKETGGTAEGVAHQLLMLTDTIKEPGYVYIYLSNDNLALRGQQVEVYFDDFEVTQAKSPVVQADDYYPFGFTFNSYQRENSVQNKFKFQGQEHVDDLDLGWDSFKWRNHQPDIGRFFNVDPLAEKYYYNSPYAFSENKVTSHVELEGLEAQDIKRQITDKNNWEELGRGVKQFGGELLKNTGLKAVWNAITALEGSIPHEDDKPRDVAGPTVTIVDSQVGPNSENLPNAEDASNNYIIDKSLLDALFAIPGRKYDGTTPRTAPGAPSKVDPEVGEKVAEVAGGVADAVSAGKEVFKPKVPDYVTQDSTLWIVGQDSTWRKN